MRWRVSVQQRLSTYPLYTMRATGQQPTAVRLRWRSSRSRASYHAGSSEDQETRVEEQVRTEVMMLLVSAARKTLATTPALF